MFTPLLSLKYLLYSFIIIQSKYKNVALATIMAGDEKN
jgi:hypothetical protein